MGRRRGLLLAVVLALAASVLPGVLAVVYRPDVIVEDYGVVAVVYRGGSLELGPRVTIKLLDAGTGPRVFVLTLTLYLWMPDGRLELVGAASSGGPVVVLSDRVYAKLRSVYGEWVAHLEASGVDPGAVGIGLIILAAARAEGKLYGGAVVVPLKPGLIERGYSATITAKVDLYELQSALTPRSPGMGAVVSTAPATGKPLPQWYREVWDCSTYPCDVWVLEDLKNEMSTCIPYALASVWGNMDKVERVLLREMLIADEYMGLRVVFAAAAAISSSTGSVHYSVPGYVWVTRSSSVANLDYHRMFMKGVDFDTASILYVGFYGDMAWGIYRLHHVAQMCSAPCVDQLVPTNILANIVVARPAGGARLDNTLACWGVEKDPWLYPLETGSIGRMYKLIWRSGWASTMRRIAENDIWVSSIDVGEELRTSPILSSGIAPLALIAAITGPRVPTTLAGALAVGVISEHVYVRYPIPAADVIVSVSYGSRIEWLYMVSPVTYRYGSASNLRLGLLYVDAYVP